VASLKDFRVLAGAARRGRDRQLLRVAADLAAEVFPRAEDDLRAWADCLGGSAGDQPWDLFIRGVAGTSCLPWVHEPARTLWPAPAPPAGTDFTRPRYALHADGVRFVVNRREGHACVYKRHGGPCDYRVGIRVLGRRPAYDRQLCRPYQGSWAWAGGYSGRPASAVSPFLLAGAFRKLWDLWTDSVWRSYRFDQ